MSNASEAALEQLLRDLIQGELAPGERVVWTGRPISRGLNGAPVGALVFGAILAAIPVFAIRDARASGERPGSGVWFAIAAVGLLGALLLCAPLVARRRLRRTIYAITDRRAIVLRLGIFDVLAVRSFEPERLFQMERTERRDGSGDLVFEVATTGSGSSTSTERRGFLGVAEVRDVESTLRATLLRDRVRDA